MHIRWKKLIFFPGMLLLLLLFVLCLSWVLSSVTRLGGITATAQKPVLPTALSTPQLSAAVPPQGSSATPGESKTAPKRELKKELKKESKRESKDWQDFSEKFGRTLKAEFTPNGQLVSIVGAPGQGVPAGSEFHPDDPQMALDRAQDILKSAAKLIHLKSHLPLSLENAEVKGGSVSAQVYFHETIHDVLLEPVGRIKIDLGSQGELLGFYSDYVPDVRIVNQVKVSLEEAKDRAKDLIRTTDKDQNQNQNQNQGQDQGQNRQRERALTTLNADAGVQVIWVEGSAGSYAYQFNVKGRQVVIDAQSGAVLHSQDRRQY